jgi:RsiW-degrading membrane proteinase PrsW (M82 family)
MTGHPCPECGQIEHYEPPRGSEVTYIQWVADHAVEVSPRKAWLIAAIVPILGVPFALGCALFTVEYLGLVNFVLFAPVASEVLKVAIASMVVERRGHLIRREGQLYVMILGTALVFSVVQNLVYLQFYFSSPSPPIELIAYRWLIGPLAHLLSAAIAAHGIVLVWRQAKEGRREPRLSKAYPWVITAIVVHSLYNLCVHVGGHLGYGF